MDFLGVGPGELILVLIIALVVVGPERLPVLARQAGKFLVNVRNWVQKSPDAAMVLRARQEIEAELANIRESLAEVQTARDEVVQAAKHVNTLVKDDVLSSTREAIQQVTQPGAVARSTKPNGLPATAAEPATPAVEAATATLEQAEAAAPEAQLIAPDGSPLVELAAPDDASIAPPRTNGATEHAPDLTGLQHQIAALTEELRQLQAQLQECGVIAPAPLVGVLASASAAPDFVPSPTGTSVEEHDDAGQPAYSAN